VGWRALRSVRQRGRERLDESVRLARLSRGSGARPLLGATSGERGGRAVARDELGDWFCYGRGVRGDREVVPTLEDDLLALWEQLMDEGLRRDVDRTRRRAP